MRRLLSFVWAMVRPIREPRVNPWAATISEVESRRSLAAHMAERCPLSPLDCEMLLIECGDSYLLAQMTIDLATRANVSLATALRLLETARGRS